MFKKIGIALAICLVIFGGIVGYCNAQGTELTADSFLRIHIRANSNSVEDQAVKYKVKDAIVEYLTPILADAKTKPEAIELVSQNLSQISNIAGLVLSDNGYNYGANAVLRSEYFPTRCYDDVVLESGEYDSLILELGSASGNNWWCVVYPPLCFVNAGDNNTENIVYRSKLLEIIRTFFGGV